MSYFVKNETLGYQLDLIASRYPGRRPSDMVDGLDSWQAIQLDAALAIKYSTLQHERSQRQHEELLATLENVMRAQGAKIKERRPTPSLIQPYRNPTDIKAIDDLPYVGDVLRELTGGMTIVNMEGITKDGS